MHAIIYKPTRSASQSGKANHNHWLMRFVHDGTRKIEPVMGWTSTKDMMQEVIMRFVSLDSAMKYAKKNNIEYEVTPAQEHKLIIRSYAENFK